MNYNWLLPICKENPTKACVEETITFVFEHSFEHIDWLDAGISAVRQVPSGFYLTDALLALDKLMGSCLLIPVERGNKTDAAAEESKRLKRLLGSLRHLFRNCYLAFCATVCEFEV